MKKKKKIKTSPNQTKMGTHTEHLNTAACHISPEGGESSPIPLPQATPIKDTIVFSFPIAVILFCMDVRVGLQRKLSEEEFMLLNCGAGEDS